MDNYQKLPQEVKERIRIRNNCVDALTPLSGDAEKADFLLQLIQDKHTYNLPTDKVMERWNWERESICLLIDIARDYVINVRKGLDGICDTLTQENKCDGGDHRMAYKMLDADLGVATCTVADMPEWLIKSFNDGELEGSLIDTTFFYERELDVVIVNSEHFHYGTYVKLVQLYLELDADDRKELKERKGMEPVRKACSTLDDIIKLREEYSGCQNFRTTS